MFRISFNIEFARDKDVDPEPIPGEGGPGNAQVEDAGYGSRPAGNMGTGFCMPDLTDPGPEGPY